MEDDLVAEELLPEDDDPDLTDVDEFREGALTDLPEGDDDLEGALTCLPWELDLFTGAVIDSDRILLPWLGFTVVLLSGSAGLLIILLRLFPATCADLLSACGLEGDVIERLVVLGV